MQMHLPFPPLPIGATDARFALSGKMLVSTAMLATSLIGPDKKCPARSTSPGGILPSVPP